MTRKRSHPTAVPTAVTSAKHTATFAEPPADVKVISLLKNDAEHATGTEHAVLERAIKRHTRLKPKA